MKLARSLGARVTGLFAAPPATPLIYRDILPVGYATPAEHARMIADSAARYLGIIERAATKAGVRFEGLHVTSDFPADVILATARKRKCDLIVMATHGHGGLKGMVLGSQTQQVLTQSKIPVLVYH